MDRILFIQLPLLDHGRNHISGNYLYAPSILTEYVTNKRNESFVANWLNPFIVNNLSDEEIIKHVIEYNPDIIGFTVFLWNAERSLLLAGKLKKRISVHILFGGPEIYRESFLFNEKRGNVDMFCSGEGEWFFSLYPDRISFTSVNNNKVAFQPRDEQVRIEDIYHPSINAISRLSSGGTYFVEMTRGCPYRCCYCNYSKNAKSIRNQPIEVLEEEIRKSNGENIYILAPSINTRADFNDLLDMLIRMRNKNKIHAEVNAAMITDGLAEKMYQAGFRSVEAGLQTLTAASREIIKRTVPVSSEINGIKALQNAGIEVKAGIIPGLPGDTVEAFLDGIDEIVERGISDTVEVYPLMILPGTELPDMYNTGIIKRQNVPPYFLLEKDGFTVESVKGIIKYKERKTGFVTTRRCMPSLSSGNGEYVKGLYVDIDCAEIYERLIPDCIQTAVFTIVGKTINSGRAYDFIHAICAEKKYLSTLINLVIESDIFLEDRVIREILEKSTNDSITTRMNIFEREENGSNVRLFQLFKGIPEYDFARLLYRAIDPILRVESDTAEIFLEYITKGNGLPKIFIRKGLPLDIREKISDYYSGAPDLVDFESMEEGMAFYQKNGHPFVRDDLFLKMVSI